jgi:beta-glucosidase
MKNIFICALLILHSSLLITANAQSKLSSWQNTSLSVDDRVKDLLSQMTLEEKCSQMVYNSPAIDRLGIREYNWWSEALHGVARMGRATVFPQPIGLSATFDPKLIRRVGDAISTEARAKFNAAIKLGNITEYGGLSFWSPNINIFRDPRWGRGMETWGEDPFLTGTLAVQFVKGMQGDNPKYLKAAACAKHYAVHSGPERQRHKFDAKPPLKDFRETYLPAFEKLVKEGKVEAVMCAYNRTYDEPCCGSPLLLRDILRDEWGFKGHIVSDCWAISDFNEYHKVTKDVVESAAKAIKAGVNLNCGNEYGSLMQAIQRNLITEEDIDRDLAPLLKTRFRLGLLDAKGKTPWDTVSPKMLNCAKHRAIALEAAEKSIVLLKNNGVLPLKKDLKRLIVTGPLAADVDVLLGNYNGVPANAVTILEGITSQVNAGTRISYHHGFILSDDNPRKPQWVTFDVNDADATVVVLGINPLWEGEEGEAIAAKSGADKSDIDLPAIEIRYLQELAKDHTKPIITIVLGGSPLNLSEVYTLSDAVLFAWYPGEQGGNAVANVLFGGTFPSGRLPVTFPVSTDQLPSFDDYSMEGRTYKYMTKEPMFPFGFGLSYTNFTYSDLHLDKSEIRSGQGLKVSATVTNNGKTAAEEVAQLYLTHSGAPFRMPKYELHGFSRVKIEPGKSVKVSFDLTPEELMAIDMEGKKVFLPGTVTVAVGGALPSQRSQALGAAMPVEGDVLLNQ